MKKITKKREESNKEIESKAYSPIEAIALIKKVATAKFIESVEAHIALNIDPRYSDQQLRTTLILPKGTGKIKRVAVLIQNEKITPEIQTLGDIVGSDILIDSITQGQLNFDILFSK